MAEKIGNLKFGCKDFEERRIAYRILANIYVKGKRKHKPITQRDLLLTIEDVTGVRLYEDTLRRYIKKVRNGEEDG